VQRQHDLAEHLLELRLALEEARTEAERGDAHRRFSELLNRGPE
jgi:hypothetical protein